MADDLMLCSTCGEKPKVLVIPGMSGSSLWIQAVVVCKNPECANGDILEKKFCSMLMPLATQTGVNNICREAGDMWNSSNGGM